MNRGARLLVRLARLLAYSAVLVLAVLYALSARAPDPELWHTVILEEEFSLEAGDTVKNFSEYLALEDRLFTELRQKVYAQTPRGADHRFERYSSGSAADPSDRAPNWNRSFELAAAAPRGGVLLLHGMSDSPYSLRAIGQTLNSQGYQVLGLRLPGHGTAPSGLLRVQWEDMAAAVRLAVLHLAEQLPGLPLHLVGYSTGAPLAINYSLDAEQDTALPAPASLVLLSPAIGVSPAAVLAQWNRRLSLLPGLGHLAWLDMLPEFDPYKYNSFATNAGEQVYRLTQSVAARIEQRAAGNPPPLPPILVLKSTVDATVSNQAVIDRLLTHLQPERHEYVLFDINRRGANASLLVNDPGPFTSRLLNDPGLPFTLTVVGNRDRDSSEVVVRRKAPFSQDLLEGPALGREWPPGTLSLSHIALPFPPDDPLYGTVRPADKGQVYLGLIAIQGERGLLRFPSDYLIRLRHNPFYEYTEQRVSRWLARTGGAAAAAELPGTPTPLL